MRKLFLFIVLILVLSSCKGKDKVKVGNRYVVYIVDDLECGRSFIKTDSIRFLGDSNLVTFRDKKNNIITVHIRNVLIKKYALRK